MDGEFAGCGDDLVMTATAGGTVGLAQSADKSRWYMDVLALSSKD